MDVAEMRSIVRRDLHDEDESSYRWTDDELDRHIAHALKDFSEQLPYESKATVATVSGSREISIAALADRVMVQAVEYPAGRFPPQYRRFAVWGDTLTILGEDVPDGADACIYYGRLHTLDASGSTVPAAYEELIVLGVCGYAAVEWAIHSVNRINTGGSSTPADFLGWGREKLSGFKSELRRLGRRNRVRVRSLYNPYRLPAGRSADSGPQG